MCLSFASHLSVCPCSDWTKLWGCVQFPGVAEICANCWNHHVANAWRDWRENTHVSMWGYHFISFLEPIWIRCAESRVVLPSMTSHLKNCVLYFLSRSSRWLQKPACTPCFIQHMKTFLQLRMKKLKQQRGTNIYCLQDEEENVSWCNFNSSRGPPEASKWKAAALLLRLV